MMPQDPLSQLRDIHLPDPAGFWPPAPGWWVVGALLLALLTVWLIWKVRRYLRQRWRKPALEQLQQLAMASHPDERWFAAVNEVLKRCAMACYPHKYPQSLTGNGWAGFLADTWPGGQQPPRELLDRLVKASWTPDAGCPPRDALDAAEHWIRGQSC